MAIHIQWASACWCKQEVDAKDLAEEESTSKDKRKIAMATTTTREILLKKKRSIENVALVRSMGVPGSV